ncbi:MAG: hypothetical protein CVV44_06935 [Spirochaetae bacterium HGW-Spirochaetae-1]|jgi:hypothetical protein|nr:MAG: hypothetical protein CVV44_06935 [Spirochaetae bacterium HGW-Spirochaetae-1]
MKALWFLRLGGIYHLFCAAIHLFFPSMFKWDEALSLLPPPHNMIMGANLNIMNLCMLFFWVMLGVLPLVFARDITESRFGRAFLAFIVLFWIFRIGVLQPIYVGFSTAESLHMTGFFIIGLVLFTVPLAQSLRSAGRERKNKEDDDGNQ